MTTENNAENRMSTDEMLTFLMAGAIEFYALGLGETEDAPEPFRNAIRPFAAAHNVPIEVVEQTLATLLEACAKAASSGKNYQQMTAPEVNGIRIFKAVDCREIVEVFATLVDAMVKLDSRADREILAALMWHLKELWDIR